jgi:NMD protein affecting ribosome stability and mRNA decay
MHRDGTGGESVMGWFDEEDVVCIDCGSTECDPPTRTTSGMALVSVEDDKETVGDGLRVRFFRCEECGYVWRE